MRRAVRTYNSAAVYHQHHGQILKREIMNYSVIGALQEGAVYIHHRVKSTGRETRRENHGVLFGYSNVIELVRKARSKIAHS